jgi:hypothetical protein
MLEQRGDCIDFKYPTSNTAPQVLSAVSGGCATSRKALDQGDIHGIWSMHARKELGDLRKSPGGLRQASQARAHALHLLQKSICL